jgi:hypothetical protein
VRIERAMLLAAGLMFAALLTPPYATGPQASTVVRRITWTDTVPLQPQLEAHGVTAGTFGPYVDRLHKSNLDRVREGDLDHLIFYALQSTHFTQLPPIEPALSAKALVDGLTADERQTFFDTSQAPLPRIPDTARARIAALEKALDSPAEDSRLQYFRALAATGFPTRATRESGLLREYLRVMRFVYEKEFVARRAQGVPDAVAALYRTRGLSTDTAVESGYLVSQGLGIIKSLEPATQIRRVLIIGPGLDLAPRTGLVEAGPPQSYQPWAIIDALLTLGLSRVEELEVVGADINPRVVENLRTARENPPTLILISGISDDDHVTLTAEYREYFAGLGRAIGDVAETARTSGSVDGHLRKSLRVGIAPARTVRAETLDIVTERLQGASFDLIVATNVLPYFNDLQLMLAMTNIGAMLAPGGMFLHNEARPLLQEVTMAIGLPFEQSRQAVIATVRGAPGPLVDSVWLHRRR